MGGKKKSLRRGILQKAAFCLLGMVICMSGSITGQAQSEYIIADSDQRYLCDWDGNQLSLRGINYAKNEIFARHGRKFRSQELQNYFDSMSWYKPLYEPDEFDANHMDSLNEIEKANAEFLSAKEYNLNANGYALDSAPQSYEVILEDYRQAFAEDFSNLSGYPYVSNLFTPEMPFYRGGDVYYAFYDFCGDGVPELVIGVDYASSDSSMAEGEPYEIVDLYGTDGTYVMRVGGLLREDINAYRLCENDILEENWSSGGMSAVGNEYLQLYPDKLFAMPIEEIIHHGSGECERRFLDYNFEEDYISEDEYFQIRDSYTEINDISFEWQSLGTQQNNIDTNDVTADIEAGPYAEVLAEYREAIANNYSNYLEFRYMNSGEFNSYSGEWWGKPLYYTMYDFLNDGRPELLIAGYREATEYGPETYILVDAYGTDGTSAVKLGSGYEQGKVQRYSFCENNVLEVHWASGGASTAGSIYFQMLPNTAECIPLEHIYHMGLGDCYRVPVEEISEGLIGYEISKEEYDAVMASYVKLEDIPFKWHSFS